MFNISENYQIDRVKLAVPTHAPTQPPQKVPSALVGMGLSLDLEGTNTGKARF